MRSLWQRPHTCTTVALKVTLAAGLNGGDVPAVMVAPVTATTSTATTHTSVSLTLTDSDALRAVPGLASVIVALLTGETPCTHTQSWDKHEMVTVLLHWFPSLKEHSWCTIVCNSETPSRLGLVDALLMGGSLVKHRLRSRQ
jgi:hypothetical protein